MANVSDVRAELQTDLPDCGNTFIDAAIIRSSRWFCEQTLVWRETLDAINVVADTYLYNLTVSDTTNSMVHSLYHVEYDDVPIKIKTEEFFDDKYKTSNWRASTATTSQWCYLTKDRSQIRLVYIPDTALASGLDVTVCLKPTLTATTIPDMLYNDYVDAIVDGAKVYLYGKTEQPWANMEYKAYYEKEFKKWIGATKRQIATGFGHIGTVG